MSFKMVAVQEDSYSLNIKNNPCHVYIIWLYLIRVQLYTCRYVVRSYLIPQRSSAQYDLIPDNAVQRKIRSFRVKHNHGNIFYGAGII